MWYLLAFCGWCGLTALVLLFVAGASKANSSWDDDIANMAQKEDQR
jgi:hypothetical protein